MATQAILEVIDNEQRFLQGFVTPKPKEVLSLGTAWPIAQTTLQASICDISSGECERLREDFLNHRRAIDGALRIDVVPKVIA